VAKLSKLACLSDHIECKDWLLFNNFQIIHGSIFRYLLKGIPISDSVDTFKHLINYNHAHSLYAWLSMFIKQKFNNFPSL
jgi:hypothetical protein